MFKIIILSNSVASTPVIDYFHAQGWMRAVVATDKLQVQNLQVEDLCRIKNIPFYKVSKKELSTTVKELFETIDPDVAIMFGFSYRIPAYLYTLPRSGFYNVHFSMLPAYGGPDPIFWQIKNGETTGGVSIHRVDDGFDTGAVVMQQQVPFIPGETWGICNGRHGAVAFNMLMQLVDRLRLGAHLNEIPVDADSAGYYPRPTADELVINWDIHTAAQVEALVNASNPDAGGAATTFRQQMVRILEVSPVDAAGDAAIPGGSIIHADHSGVYVQCADHKILRINILRLNEGFVTGGKLAAMGVQRGERFENGVFQYQE